MSLTEALSQSGLEAIDFVIFFTYIILLVSLGVFLSRNRDTRSRSATDYFLAGNTLTWWAVGASLIAANISTEQFIGMAGTGYADGIAAILSAGPEDEQYADCADWLGIESPKEAQDWIAGQKAFPAEISDDLQFIDEQFRSRPAPKSRKRSNEMLHAVVVYLDG